VSNADTAAARTEPSGFVHPPAVSEKPRVEPTLSRPSQRICAGSRGVVMSLRSTNTSPEVSKSPAQVEQTVEASPFPAFPSPQTRVVACTGLEMSAS